MGTVISGAMIVGALLTVSLLIFSTFLTSSATQATSVQYASDAVIQQTNGVISITSTGAADTGDGTSITGDISNTGSISYSTFSELDVLVRYTDSTGDQVAKRLQYVCKDLCGDSTDLGSNKWTVSSISPDGYNPKMWDPDEKVVLELKADPTVKSGTSGILVVVVPGGVLDSAYFNN